MVRKQLIYFMFFLSLSTLLHTASVPGNE
jgi:hypothetical protein